MDVVCNYVIIERILCKFDIVITKSGAPRRKMSSLLFVFTVKTIHISPAERGTKRIKIPSPHLSFS